MKKFLKSIIAIILVITIITLFLVNNGNASELKADKLSYAEVEISELDPSDVPNIDENSTKLLQLFGKELYNIINVRLIWDDILDRQVIRVRLNNCEVDITDNGNIVGYKNFEDYRTKDKDKRDYESDEPLVKEDYSVKNQNDLAEVINKIEEYCVLTDYLLVDCSNNIQGIWALTWIKSYNEIRNPYENVNVIVDARDGTIMLFAKCDNPPNVLTPVLTEDDAIEIAKKDLSEFKYEKIDANIELYKENGLDGKVTNVKLVWSVLVDENIVVYVDAIDGKILFKDATQSDYARSMCTCPFIGQSNRASMAYSAFSTLGYNQTGYPAVSWDINQTDIDWVLSRPNLYGLYLGCHGKYYGSYSTLTDNDDWCVYSSTSYGNWHFVYLDACESSLGNNWAYSFGATSSGRCFVGWNVKVYQSTAYDFDQRFFPRLGYMSVYDDVVTSFWESRNAGYNVVGGNICDPGFAGDANYYGWAW